MAYLLIIIIVALAGITRITLQQRRENKLHVQNDYRSSLEKVATQPLATPDDGPRRRFELAGWTDRRKARQESVAKRQPRRRDDGLRSATKPPRDGRNRPKRDRTMERSRDRSRERRSRYEQSRQRRSQSAARYHAAGRMQRRRARVPQDHYDEVQWHEEPIEASREIRLDHDIAPARIPVSSRRLSQPTSRGSLQTEFHAAIHPAHLPPQTDFHIDLTAGELQVRRRAG